MNTVLGLSVTPTTVGWVLAEGHGAKGAILSHREFELCGGYGVRAVSTAEQVADEVWRVKAMVAADNQRLQVIGVTWNDEASAQAALLLESLTNAGFDNVVPICFLEAVETLARAVAPVIGYEQTVVCLLEHEWATVVMVDTHDGESQTAVKHVHGGFDGLISWLTGMFDRNSWCPAGVVVVGSHTDIDGLSWQLERALPVPVFAQNMAQVTIARGTALAAAQSTEFTDKRLAASTSEFTVPVRPRRLSYAGAVTALAAAVITFVTALSLAVGLQLAPDANSVAPKHAVRQSLPQIAEAPASVASAPAKVAASPGGEVLQPTSQAQPPISLTSAQPGTEPATPLEQQSVTVDLQPDPNGEPFYTMRVLEHIPGTYGDLTPDNSTQP
ncbi:hypothetical protein MUBE_13365 [Mycobacterium uberis]|uniref:DUF7159 domain-containing protein n=1 Tax=Mycobacterium uberis TaxID=2162698 RepID=A0A3E1HED1_9MYCO|nr:hypothetical protein [Mycobacterium uberis]RFD24645.1 hypothetical protein MUBE_13365 [Mycobacterium uberis]